ALSTASTARAQGTSFEGAGQAPIVAGDKVRARARALDDAFRAAVDSAAAALLEPAVLAQRQSALKLTVEPKARRYVTGYRVLDEGEQGSTFHLRVAAEIALDRLERDLGAHAATAAGAARAPGGAPRVGQCLVERRSTGEPCDAGGAERLAASLDTTGGA